MSQPAPQWIAALILAATMSGCDSPTPPDPLLGECRQTYEFGNHGCVRFVVLLPDSVDEVPTTLSWSAHWDLDGEDGSATMPFVGDPLSRVLEIRRWRSPPAGPEQIDLVTRIFDQANAPLPRGERFPLFAMDSATYTVTFTPVGSVPVPDTIRLALAN